MGTLLPNLDEIEMLENPNYFTRLEDRKVGQLSNADRVRADELRLEIGFTFFEEEFEDFLKVGV